MKSLFTAFISLIIAGSAFAVPSEKIEYTKVELCDSGYCDLTQCQMTLIDGKGVRKTKTYNEMDKHQPRICELLYVDDTITVKYLGRSKLCIQDLENSSFDLNYIELEDCEYYRYGR